MTLSFLAPIALAAVLLVPLAIYAIHWLFGTRKRMQVPALFLWTDLPGLRTGRNRRRLPPFSLLLLLQLLIAIAAGLALARPVLPTPPPKHVALILDASGSMQSTDVAPTRFDAARQAALGRLNALQAADVVSLIRAGKQATLLGSGPPTSVTQALQTAQPGATAPAIREALALASTRISATPNREGEIVLFTDGAWPAPDSVGPLAAPVEVVPTGGGSDNQAITALVVRFDPSGHGQSAFVEVANEGDHDATFPLQLTGDNAPLDQRQVTVAARSRVQLSIPLPSDAHHVSAKLLSHDALSLDDQLDTLGPGGLPREVDVLGEVSAGLRRAVESIPTLRVRTADSARPAELTVLAGVLPGQLPPGPLLLVDPPANSARLLGVGLGSGARLDATDPLLQGLDLVALESQTPSVSGVPGWAHVVLGTQAGPLLMDGKLEGHPVVSLTFNPSITGLEKSLAFPLLISNATAYLLDQAEVSQAASVNAEAFDRAESDIHPRPLPTFQAASQSSATGGTSEAWPWLAAAAVVLLGLEWLVFARRG